MNIPKLMSVGSQIGERPSDAAAGGRDDARGREAGAPAGRAPIWLLVLPIAIYSLVLCNNMSNDLYWQLRAGEEMLRTHAVPRVDTYSWSASGHPWVVHEWLAFVLYAAAYQLGHGFGGVWVLQAAIAAALFVTLFAVVRRAGASPLLAFTLTVCAQIGIQIFMQPRPQLFTYLFLVITIDRVLAYRRRPERPAVLAPLVPLFALWGNLHSGVAVGLIFLALAALGDAAVAARDRKAGSTHARAAEGGGASMRTAAATCAATALCGLASLCNPYGWRIYEDLLQTVSNRTAMNMVKEWATPDFHDLFGHQIELVLAVIFLGYLASRRRHHPGDTVLLVLLVHQTLGAVRNFPLLVLASAPLLAVHLQDAIERLLERLELVRASARPAPATAETPRPDGSRGLDIFGMRPPAPTVAFVGIGAIVLSLAAGYSVLATIPAGPQPRLERIGRFAIGHSYFPEDACEFLDRENVPVTMPLWNIYGDGGFLIWREPRRKVFIDGRADVYFGPVLEDYARLVALPYDWEKTVDKWHPELVLTNTRDPQSKLFMSSPEWALVYVSDPDLDQKVIGDRLNALILIRRTPANAALIARCRHDCPATEPGGPIEQQFGPYAALQ